MEKFSIWWHNDCYMDGKIDIDNLIMVNIKIGDINKGFAEMHNNIRTVVTF
ncbi:hypothetical protein [Francisella persica]|uniref:hypothetical protein n=1 Tax=Francisella persica TaxID=954 RepID=UPI000B30CDE5